MTDNALQAFQFDVDPVRVVMLLDDPWFVANDVAKVLGYTHAPHMTRFLEEDEKGVHIVDTLGGSQQLTIISESGLYAAIFKSRRAEAQRFRKWVTGEVLPTLRRTGRFDMRPDEARDVELAADFDPSKAMAGVAVVREARRLFGATAARRMWQKVGLPQPLATAMPSAEADELAEPLRQWLDGQQVVTIPEAAAGLGIADALDPALRRRLGALLRLMWGAPRKAASAIGAGTSMWTWHRPAPPPSIDGEDA